MKMKNSNQMIKKCLQTIRINFKIELRTEIKKQ